MHGHTDTMGEHTQEIRNSKYEEAKNLRNPEMQILTMR